MNTFFCLASFTNTQLSCSLEGGVYCIPDLPFARDHPDDHRYRLVVPSHITTATWWFLSPYGQQQLCASFDLRPAVPIAQEVLVATLPCSSLTVNLSSCLSKRTSWPFLFWSYSALVAIVAVPFLVETLTFELCWLISGFVCVHCTVMKHVWWCVQVWNWDLFSRRWQHCYFLFRMFNLVISGFFTPAWNWNVRCRRFF